MSDESIDDFIASDDSGDESASGGEPETPEVKKKPAPPKKKKADNGEAKPKVAKPKAKAAPKKKKAASDAEDGDNTPKKKQKSGPVVDYDNRTIEEIYQKKTHLEQILLRPDTYIGAAVEQEQPMWVYDERVGMTYREVKFVPGLYKIFDEILVNAADNKQRDPEGMDTIRVDIDKENNEISVFNNGRGIPVVIHKEHSVYVPELIFGHLLTSSHYNDDIKKVVGGRNGYGAKLCNIFSTKFIIETNDSQRGKQYKQIFSKNMSEKGEPKIVPGQSKDWTKVTFKPDLRRFGMSELTVDTVALMKKRVYDMAGCCPGVKVFLNGTRLPVRNFRNYIELYTKKTPPPPAEPEPGDGGIPLPSAPPKEVPILIVDGNERWEIGISISESGFQQVSFVNSICTMKGGTHINYIVDKIVEYLQPILTKKNKNTAVKPFMIKNHLWVFCRALVENPAFDSQTKENLTSKASSFGSLPKFDEKFLKKLAKSELVDMVLHYAQFKQNAQLKKQSGSKRERVSGITKLTDATDAGGKNADKCTLILTEGDSAKSTAIAGVSVVGQSRYGVFPLRGKLLNVRDISHKRLLDNEEITNIIKILGLKHGVKYTDTKSLRYGHLMVMTDQDHDGSHIKGLVLNFIHTFWPELLRVPGFAQQFITPIVKATKGKERVSFFTIPEYVKWKEAHNGGKGWHVRYYKGLGTSTREEAIEYFSDLDKHKIDFTYTGPRDDEMIELAFHKKKAAERKTWLTAYEPGTHVDYTRKKMPYHEFVNKEFILFSIADCVRAIPCMVDGLKPSQRKILYGAFKRNLVHDMKVQQLSGYISGETAYHHGEVSLQQTIISMAQSFVGKNNINYLYPSGAFGTRLAGGKDAASARYTFTRLCKVTRHIFHPDDDDILEYLDDDGQPIEPKWYIPVVPTILVNGSEGIGVGWSTSVPCFNPRDLVDNLKRLLDGHTDIVPLEPWYRGFKGTIEPEPNGKSYRIIGKWEKIDEQTIRITELPIGSWTQKYQKFLEECVIGNEPKEKKRSKKKDADADGEEEGEKKGRGAKSVPFIQSYKVKGDDLNVNFEVSIAPETLRDMENKGTVESKLKLSTTVNKANMHLFDPQGRIKRYETAEQVLSDFYDLRLEYYTKRKEHKMAVLREEDEKLANKVRFIQMVIDGKLVLSKKKKAALLQELKTLKFKPFPPRAKKSTPVTAVPEAEEGDEEEEDEAPEAGSKPYDYLLGMPLWSLTQERVTKLQEEKDRKAAELLELEKTDPKTFYRRDLDKFIEALDVWEEVEYSAMQASGAKKKVLAKKKKMAADEGDEYGVETFGSSKRKPGTAKKAAVPISSLIPKKEFEVKKMESKLEADTKVDDFEVTVVPKKETKPPTDSKQLTLDAFAKKPAVAPAKPKPAAAPVKKEAPAPAANGSSIFDDEDDTPLTALLAKPLTKAAPKKPESDSDDDKPVAILKPKLPSPPADSDDEVFIPLAQRLAMSAAASGSTSAKQTLQVLSSLSPSTELPVPKIAVPPTKKKAAARTAKPAAADKKRPKKAKESESESESEAEPSLLSDDVSPPPKKLVKKSSGPSKQESDDGLLLDSDDEEKKPRKKPAPRAATRPAVKKDDLDDEEEEASDESDEGSFKGGADEDDE